MLQMFILESNLETFTLEVFTFTGSEGMIFECKLLFKLSLPMQCWNICHKLIFMIVRQYFYKAPQLIARSDSSKFLDTYLNIYISKDLTKCIARVFHCCSQSWLLLSDSKTSTAFGQKTNLLCFAYILTDG